MNDMTETVAGLRALAGLLALEKYFGGNVMLRAAYTAEMVLGYTDVPEQVVSYTIPVSRKLILRWGGSTA